MDINNLSLCCYSHTFLIGSVCGSVLGGRWSDHVLAHLKAKNGGVSKPEVCSALPSQTTSDLLNIRP